MRRSAGSETRSSSNTRKGKAGQSGDLWLRKGRAISPRRVSGAAD